MPYTESHSEPCKTSITEFLRWQSSERERTLPIDTESKNITHHPKNQDFDEVEFEKEAANETATQNLLRRTRKNKKRKWEPGPSYFARSKIKCKYILRSHTLRSKETS